MPRPPQIPSVEFNRVNAVADADFSWNRSYPHPYERFPGTDCTNFVSQAWHFGGGLQMNDGWFLRDDPGAWWRGERDFSASWVNVVSFANYMEFDWEIASWRPTNIWENYNSADLADAILYDWGEGDGYSHMAIEAGWDGNGDYIDQHTTDRFHSPWNLGWQQQSDPQVRSRMRAQIIHVND
jgi:hypothetical protein